MTDDDTSEGGFVRRWSRLKRADGQATADATVAAELERAALDEGGELAPLDEGGDLAQREADEEVKELSAEDLPDIDSLEADSDFTPFMQAGVPERLKNLALRKLWRSDPILANVDGLNDYDEDFKLAMEIGTIFMDKARAAGAKFIGEHPDEPEPSTEPEEQAERSEEDLPPDEAARQAGEVTKDEVTEDEVADKAEDNAGDEVGDTGGVDAAVDQPKDPDIEDI